MEIQLAKECYDTLQIREFGKSTNCTRIKLPDKIKHSQICTSEIAITFAYAFWCKMNNKRNDGINQTFPTL